MTDHPRIVQAMVRLPDYATPAERIATVDADVRDAAAKCDRMLRDYAQKFTVQGWVADDDAEFAVVSRTVIGRLRLTRGGAV
jgi:hypothetical protein